MRTKNVMSVADGHIEILTEEQLLDMLGIDKNVYEEVKTWSLAKIRGYGIPKPKYNPAQTKNDKSKDNNKDKKDE